MTNTLHGILTVSNNQLCASLFPCMPEVFKLHLQFTCIFLKFLELTEYNNITDTTPPPHPPIHQRRGSFHSPLTTPHPYCKFQFVIKTIFVGQLLAHDPGRGVKFSLLQKIQTGSGAHPGSYSMGAGVSFPGSEAAKVWGLPFTSTLLCAFMAWIGKKITLLYLTAQYQTSSKFVAGISGKKHTDKHTHAPNYVSIWHREYTKTMSYGLTLIYFKSDTANFCKTHFNIILSTRKHILFRLAHGVYTRASSSNKQ
jgi:hypothetical protein